MRRPAVLPGKEGRKGHARAARGSEQRGHGRGPGQPELHHLRRSREPAAYRERPPDAGHGGLALDRVRLRLQRVRAGVSDLARTDGLPCAAPASSSPTARCAACSRSGWKARSTDAWDPLDLLPVERRFFPPIPVGNTPLWEPRSLRRDLEHPNLFIKDDTLNPTGSLKDRASFLVAAFARKHRIRNVVVASTGNAASSMAGVGAAAGLHVTLFVPKTAPQGQDGPGAAVRGESRAGRRQLRSGVRALAGVRAAPGATCPATRRTIR